ncbi:MAG: hypothetical protein AAGM38_08755 [Pseudomonadota bacterium]
MMIRSAALTAALATPGYAFAGDAGAAGPEAQAALLAGVAAVLAGAALALSRLGAGKQPRRVKVRVDEGRRPEPRGRR